jgi:hypothetical protein
VEQIGFAVKCGFWMIIEIAGKLLRGGFLVYFGVSILPSSKKLQNSTTTSCRTQQRQVAELNNDKL